MKFNLGCGDDIRSGYINIDKVHGAQIPEDLYRQGDITSLDWLAEDGSVDEIIALDCLEYLPVAKIHGALNNWANKLSKDGTLKILVPDCFAVSQAFVQGQFDLREYLQIIFGTQDNGDNRMSAIDTFSLVKCLEDASLTITVKRYEGVAIYVEATK